MKGALPLVLWTLAACAQKPSPPDAARPTNTGLAKWERIGIEGGLRGISGVAEDGAGRLWAVPERDRQLIGLDLVNRGLTVSLPITGAPEGLDLEAATWAGDRMIFGTEAKGERQEDQILYAEILADRVEVKASIAISYAGLGKAAESNHGIEGLCHAADVLLVVSETLFDGAPRQAPLWIIDDGEKKAELHRINLTSETGKISDIACRLGARGIDVVAIERHFEVVRVIWFRIPKRSAPEVIEPLVLVDLAPILGPKPPNFEGIRIVADRQLMLISDNDYGGVSGPTEILLLDLADDPATGGFSGRVQ